MSESLDLSKYGTVNPPPSGGSLDLSKYGTANAAEPKGAVERFLTPFDPRPMFRALLKPSDDPKEDPRATFGKNVIGLIHDLGMAQVDQGKAAIKSWNEGDHTSAIAHGLSAITPILGPMSQQAAEKFNEGDVAGGLGTVTAMAAPELIHEAPGAIRATGEAVAKGANAVGDFATSPSIVKSLKRSSEGAVVGSAMHGNVPGMAVGGAARYVAEKLGEIGERRAAAAAGPAIPQIWNDLAGPGGYAKLTDVEQAQVRNIASRIQGGAQPEAPQGPQAPRDASYYGVQPQQPPVQAAPPAASPVEAPVTPPEPTPAPVEAPAPPPAGQAATAMESLAGLQKTAARMKVLNSLSPGKNYLKLSPEAQAAVRALADANPSGPAPLAAEPMPKPAAGPGVITPRLGPGQPPPIMMPGAAGPVEAAPPLVGPESIPLQGPANQPAAPVGQGQPISPAPAMPGPQGMQPPTLAQVGAMPAQEVGAQPAGTVPMRPPTGEQPNSITGELPSPRKLITGQGIKQFAKDNGIPEARAEDMLRADGYAVLERQQLNKMVHAAGAERGLDHAALSEKANNTYGSGMGKITDDNLLEMYHDLASKQAMREPLAGKGATSSNAPSIEAAKPEVAAADVRQQAPPEPGANLSPKARAASSRRRKATK